MVRASLGAAGGSFNASTAVNETYPMYVLPIATLLEMTEWIPHQELLAQNKLVKLSEVEADASEVIFLSHQWVWPAGNHASSSPTPLAHPRVLFDTYIYSDQVVLLPAPGSEGRSAPPAAGPSAPPRRRRHRRAHSP